MILENLKMAIDAIFANKMRSFLTMLGIIIGTSSVIAILAVGSGATQKMTNTFNDIGATTISLTTDAAETEQELISPDDLEVLKSSIDEIKYISPEKQLTGQISSDDSDSRLAALSFGTPDLQYISSQMDSEVLHGRYFNQNDYDMAADVIVIDSDTAEALFNKTDVVGESIQLSLRNSALNLTVVGVVQGMFSELQGDFAEDGMPVFASAPMTTIEKYFPEEGKIDQSMIRVGETNQIEPVSNQVVKLLELRHNQVGEEKYNATNFLNALDQLDQVLGLFINFIAAVAGIALLVGGIGVMNIMLVSVTERTKEIGTRKAIGATTKHILTQFLMESIIISLFGGFIGLVIGIVASNLIASALGVAANFTIGSVLLVLGFSSAVGIFFGIYPARKAAHLNPIDALRHE